MRIRRGGGQMAWLKLSTSKYLLCNLVCFFGCAFFVGSATAQTYQSLLEDGRNQLLQQTTSGVLAAKTTLLQADIACPNNVSEKKDIKLYLALAKLGCRFVEDNGGTVDTLAEV